jgi:hypothetical protein
MGILFAKNPNPATTEVITDFQVKQSLPPSDGLVGIHHKLVNHRCALEEWVNKKKKKVLGQC